MSETTELFSLFSLCFGYLEAYCFALYSDWLPHNSFKTDCKSAKSGDYSRFFQNRKKTKNI